MPKLSNEERAERAIQLAKAWTELGDMEEAKRADASRHRSLIEVQEARISKLAQEVRTGMIAEADAQVELPLGAAGAEEDGDDDASPGLEQIEAQEAERSGEEPEASA